MNNIKVFKDPIENIISFLNCLEIRSFFDQMHYLQQLLDLIENGNQNLFLEKINSAELWGGSGSLWESEYGMTRQERALFEQLLLTLLSSMKGEGIMKRRAKEIFRLLSQDKSL